MKKIALIALLGLSLTGCSKDSVERTDLGEKVPIMAEAVIAGDAGSDLETRARQNTGGKGLFDVGSQIGLGLTNSSDGSFGPVYDNMMGLYSGTNWGYYIDGIYNGLILSGFSSWVYVNLYGYYPYDNTVTDFTNIPFRIAEMTGSDTAEAYEDEVSVDYMVAGPKSKSMSASGYLSLQFHHIFTGIDVRLRREHTGPDIILAGATFEISGGQSFGISGKYTAKTLVTTDPGANVHTIDESATELEIYYTSADKIIKHAQSPTAFQQSPLAVMPELRCKTGNGGADDATVTITLHFTDTDGDPYIFEDKAGDPVISFLLSSVDNGSGADKGLLAGYVYAIQASIGSYVQFSGGPKIVYQDLVDDEDPEYIKI